MGSYLLLDHGVMSDAADQSAQVSRVCDATAGRERSPGCCLLDPKSTAAATHPRLDPRAGRAQRSVREIAGLVNSWNSSAVKERGLISGAVNPHRLVDPGSPDAYGYWWAMRRLCGRLILRPTCHRTHSRPTWISLVPTQTGFSTHSLQVNSGNCNTSTCA